jgi:cytoskeleton protein RodZ
MSGVGERLRQARLAKGISLSEIAAETRISARYLEALEREDYEELPGAIFSRNFARQYARYVGLDERELEKALEVSLPKPPEVPVEQLMQSNPAIRVAPLTESLNFDASAWRRARWSGLALVAVMGAGSAAYMGWQELPGIFDEARRAARAQHEMAAAGGGELRTAGPGGGSASMSPVSSGDAAGASANTTISISANGMAVEVAASEPTWLSVSANGKKVWSGILNPNETRTIEGVENAKLIVGNAGGIQIRTNGKSIGEIGPRGQVRVVILSPEGSQILRNPRPAQDSDTTSTD